jgi:hypothetical protein
MKTLLSRSPAIVAPRLLGAEFVDATTYLYVEWIAPWRRWPWRESSLAALVLEQLAHVHTALPVAPVSTGLAEWDVEADLLQTAWRTLELLETAARQAPLAPARRAVPARRSCWAGDGRGWGPRWRMSAPGCNRWAIGSLRCDVRMIRCCATIRRCVACRPTWVTTCGSATGWPWRAMGWLGPALSPPGGRRCRGPPGPPASAGGGGHQGLAADHPPGRCLLAPLTPAEPCPRGPCSDAPEGGGLTGPTHRCQAGVAWTTRVPAGCTDAWPRAEARTAEAGRL